MEERNIPDYKLDGFLKDFFLQKLASDDFTFCLPAIVQVTHVQQELGEWSSYDLIDKEFEMWRCTFVSKQTRPECFSILKITKISKLSLDVSDYIDMDIWYINGEASTSTVLGEIEFDIEVSGEKIGNTLYWDNKHINMQMLKERNVVGLWELQDVFKTNPSEKMMRSMWENRSEKFCSVRFTFKDESVVVVYAHKSVLVQISQVFKAHLDNEGFSDSNVVPLVDTNFYYFNKFLEFIYTGKVQFTTKEVAFELLYLSKKYLMTTLQELCRNVIRQFCANSHNLLKALDLNQKANDEILHRLIESDIESSLIRDVVNCKDFLDCDFSTVEWILSSDYLDIDEYSLLCAVYKWACHNGITAFCHNTEHQMDESLNCLHGILECIHFEMIDMISLLRFLKLPKLSEIVDVDELKMSIFESLQEDGSYFDNLDVGTNCYSKRRLGVTFYTEIPIGTHGLQETRMKNIPLHGGPVLGFKVKVVKEDLGAGEHSLDVSLSFQYLYTTAEEATEDFHIYATPIEFIKKTREIRDIDCIDWIGQLEKGEWQNFKLDLKDCRRYLTNKIEDFGIENSGGPEKDRVLAFELGLCYNP